MKNHLIFTFLVFISQLNISFANSKNVFPSSSDTLRIQGENMQLRELLSKTVGVSQRQNIGFGSNGLVFLRRKNIEIEYNCPNFKSLISIIEDTITYRLKMSKNFIYINEYGEQLLETMSANYNVSYETSLGPVEERLTGWYGVTQTPGKEANKYNSVNQEVWITINPELEEIDRLMNICHELYGHAYLYSKRLDHEHKVTRSKKGGFLEGNNLLKECINESQSYLNSILNN